VVDLKCGEPTSSGGTGRATGGSKHVDRSPGWAGNGGGWPHAAIAVLIMAFLGAAMWVGFQRMWKSTESTTQMKVEQIGSE
jgi:hypothetical protein